MDVSVPIAVVDPKRQVTIIPPAGMPASPLGGELLWASWGALDPAEVHSWPTWSPDGRRLASFSIARSGAGNRVLVTDVGGVQSTEVCALGTRMPIYLQWSADGRQIAVLSQESDRLVLEHANTEDVGPSHQLLTGSPLFFTWLDDLRLAAFVGEPGGPRLAVLDPTTGARHHLPGQPGNFCAPIALGDEVLYAAHHEGRVSVLVAPPDGGEARALDDVEGLAALVVSPDRSVLAMAVAPDGSGAAYTDLHLIDVASGESRPLCDLDCLAFLWAPTGDALVIARRDEKRGTIAWHRVDLDGTTELLAEVHPTRDMRFYLRFFEQYCTSHPLIDPTGNTLLVAGTLSDADDSDGLPRIWAVPLDGSPPEELCPGLFAVFGPPGA